MDIQKIMSKRQQGDEEEEEDEEDKALPGFRFHPTDEELVGFYLRRKVDKKPLHIDIIKQIDIYKYDPWDLPKGSDVRDREWYFFCKRGRKYRNSIRPNRVTGSGFWKATGIDRAVYSSGSGMSVCIGLKKSLVYYRGSAGKGTKTEWMMHEFRLPNLSEDHTKRSLLNQLEDDKSLSHEAEVWTLCRILKRNMSQKKTLPDLKHFSTKRNLMVNMTSKPYNQDMQGYIRFQSPMIQLNYGMNAFTQQDDHHHQEQEIDQMNDHMTAAIGPLIISTSVASDQAPSASSSCFSDQDMNEITKRHGDHWGELRSIVEFASSDQSVLFM